jgi:hypothetical protein
VTGIQESNKASAPISRFSRHSTPPQALRHSTSDGSSKTIFEQPGSKLEAMFRRFIVSLILDVAGRESATDGMKNLLRTAKKVGLRFGARADKLSQTGSLDESVFFAI